MTQKPSLRESKRQRTHAAIEDHATRLVLERGYEDVTVEDIHQAVGISRRTFFNYVDSKEIAVMGPAATVPDEAVCEEFLACSHDDLLGDLMDLLFASLLGGSLTSSNAGELLRRRKLILQENPLLMAGRFGQSHTVYQALVDLTQSYLTAHPKQRQIPDIPLSQEALTIIALLVTAHQLGTRLWMKGTGITLSSLRYSCHTALTHLTELQRTAS